MEPEIHPGSSPRGLEWNGGLPAATDPNTTALVLQTLSLLSATIYTQKSNTE